MTGATIDACGVRQQALPENRVLHWTPLFGERAVCASVSRLISRLRCAARAGFAFRSRLYSRLRRKSCLRSADLSDWIGYRAAGFLLRAAPAGVMINDTEQNRSRRRRRRLRKHSGNVHFRRLQGMPLTPMPPAGGRSSGRVPRKGDRFEQKTRYPPHAL